MFAKETATIPKFFAPILWSYNLSEFEIQKNKQIIIMQTINYGSWKHWQWITHTYGKEELRSIISEIPASAFRAPALHLASILFDITTQHHAHRGTHN